MKNFYGPFFEGKDDVWHWRRECPNFPSHPNPKMMVSSSFPDKIELCKICAELDEKNAGDSKMSGQKK